jgi:hypothetical protein
MPQKERLHKATIRVFLGASGVPKNKDHRKSANSLLFRSTATADRNNVIAFSQSAFRG